MNKVKIKVIPKTNNCYSCKHAKIEKVYGQCKITCHHPSVINSNNYRSNARTITSWNTNLQKRTIRVKILEYYEQNKYRTLQYKNRYCDSNFYSYGVPEGLIFNDFTTGKVINTISRTKKKNISKLDLVSL